MEALGGFAVVVALFGLVLAILWALMPFAVFGIKDLARSLIAEQKKTNALLEKLHALNVALPPRNP